MIQNEVTFLFCEKGNISETKIGQSNKNFPPGPPWNKLMFFGAKQISAQIPSLQEEKEGGTVLKFVLNFGCTSDHENQFFI